jgi:shikimate 5-dehydrogenase
VDKTKIHSLGPELVLAAMDVAYKGLEVELLRAAESKGQQSVHQNE